MASQNNRMNKPESIPEELLSALLDGELNAAEVEQVNRALANDADLRATLEELRQLRGELRSLPRLTLSADFTERVTAACRDVERVPFDGDRKGELTPASVAAARKSVTAGSNGRSRNLRMIMALGAMAATILIGLFAMNADRPTLSVAMNDANIDAASAEQKSSSQERVAPAQDAVANADPTNADPANDVSANDVSAFDVAALDASAEGRGLSFAAEAMRAEEMLEDELQVEQMSDGAVVSGESSMADVSQSLAAAGGQVRGGQDFGAELANETPSQASLAMAGVGEYDAIVRLVATESERSQLAGIASIASTLPQNIDLDSAVTFRFFAPSTRSTQQEGRSNGPAGLNVDQDIAQQVDTAAAEMRVIEGTAAEIAEVFASLNLRPASPGLPPQGQLAALGIAEPATTRANRGVASETLANETRTEVASSSGLPPTANTYAIQPARLPQAEPTLTPPRMANEPTLRTLSAEPMNDLTRAPKLASSATPDQSVPQSRSAARRYGPNDDAEIPTPSSPVAPAELLKRSTAVQSLSDDAGRQVQTVQQEMSAVQESADSELPNLSSFGGASRLDRRYRILLLVQPAE